MSNIETTANAPRKQRKRGQRRKPWPQLAAQHGVSTRTLDRWVDDGIIAPAEYINGRKYGDPDEVPRLDVTRPKARSNRDAGTGLLLKSAT